MASKVPKAKPASPRLKNQQVRTSLRISLPLWQVPRCRRPGQLCPQQTLASLSLQLPRLPCFLARLCRYRRGNPGHSQASIQAQGLFPRPFHTQSHGVKNKDHLRSFTTVHTRTGILRSFRSPWVFTFFLSLVHYAQLHQHNNQINLRSFSSAPNFGVVAATDFNGMAIFSCPFLLEVRCRTPLPIIVTSQSFAKPNPTVQRMTSKNKYYKHVKDIMQDPGDRQKILSCCIQMKVWLTFLIYICEAGRVADGWDCKIMCMFLISDNPPDPSWAGREYPL